MNAQKSVRLIFAVPMMLLGLAIPRLGAAEVAAAPAAAAVTYTEEQKGLLKALDDALERFDALLAQDTDVQNKAVVSAYLNGYKDRPAAIKEDDALLALYEGPYWPKGFKERAVMMHSAPFDQSKYDELRYDIDVQYQRLVMFLAPPMTAVPASKSEIAIDELSPSPSNKAEVKAALDVLDHKIKQMEERNNARPSGAGRDADAARIKNIKGERAALATNFTKAHWDVVVSEMKAAQ